MQEGSLEKGRGDFVARGGVQNLNKRAEQLDRGRKPIRNSAIYEALA